MTLLKLKSFNGGGNGSVRSKGSENTNSDLKQLKTATGEARLCDTSATHSRGGRRNHVRAPPPTPQQYNKVLSPNFTPPWPILRAFVVYIRIDFYLSFTWLRID